MQGQAADSLLRWCLAGVAVFHDRLPFLHLYGRLVDPVSFAEHLVSIDERVLRISVLF